MVCFQLLLRALLAPGFLLLSTALAPASPQENFAGTWEGQFVSPFDPKPMKIRFGIEQSADGSWRGGFDTDLLGPGLVQGELDGEGLKLDCDFGGGNASLRLTDAGEEGLRGLLVVRGLPITLTFHRTASEWAPDLRFEVALPRDRPAVVTLEGLPDFWLEPIQGLVTGAMDRGSIAGLALAVAVDAEVLDARAWGYRDVKSALPVNGETLFRWASISKSITGVVAGKLSVEGTLDLDQDVRKLVPEFPKKKYVVTSRLLLGHLAGLVHYQHMPGVTREDYGVEFPFRDPVRAIDMFRSAPLIHEPGSAYSYSTHGFALLGAVIERSSKRGYIGEVRRLVSGPLKMESLEPDDPGAPDQRRTTGYRRAADGRLFDAGDSNVAWKLAGGGFQSTVMDLGRFGAGLCDDGFLNEPLQKLLWTAQRTSGDERTGYGLGFEIRRSAGRLLVSHGGAQRRTRTFLLCAPREGIAVALMCNTEGSDLQSLGHSILKVLLNEE